ncbi:imm11 family protein [Sorangium sp. So ce341]|uniref:imm11 family protein n=1 Tax=Sorangium sp. So ce341 TaxID=3133302 RepID=UPI003F6023BC
MLDTLADRGQGEYCFMSDEPEGIGASTYRLALGDPLREMVEGDVTLTWTFGADYQGIKLSSFLGNTGRFLAVHRDVSDLVKRHRCDDLEVVPFMLRDHRKRVKSSDYVFLNPIGAVDCMNLALSVVRRARSGDVLDVPKMVLDPAKLVSAPDLFRVREVPSRYLFSGDLVDAIRAAGFTNFVFRELAMG